MADYSEEIAALRDAIASGVTRVVTQTGGNRKEVEYASFDDMRKRLEWLSAQQDGARPVRVILAGF
jgi:hypothetical protein